MYRSIYEHIIDSMNDRSISIINHITSHNKHYAALTSEILKLQNELLELLPEDYQALLFDYEILWGERDSLKNLILYRQGVMDGIKIKNLVSGNLKKRYPII